MGQEPPSSKDLSLEMEDMGVFDDDLPNILESPGQGKWVRNPMSLKDPTGDGKKGCPSPCPEIEDIFCFSVENICGYQTIGWLVKFRGRTFKSFLDINMRCIKILISVLV